MPHPTRRRLLIFSLPLLLIALIALIIIYYRVSPTSSVFFPKCAFLLLTGLKCPGCGTTRMCLSLLHGNVRAAVYYNKIVPFLLPPLAIIFVRQCYNYVFNGKFVFSKLEHWFFIISIVILLIYMVLRNIF